MADAIRTIAFTVTENGIEPSVPQYAGVQGDHNAAQVTFTLGFAQIDPDYRYRIEYVDGTGAFDTTEFLTPTQGVVSCLLPCAWTASGGTAEIRLVVSLLDETNREELIVYSLAGRLKFDTREDGGAVIQDTFSQGLSGLIAEAEEATDAAGTAASAANLAAGSANTAAGAANRAADLANTAASYANSAARNANTAADYAKSNAELAGNAGEYAWLKAREAEKATGYAKEAATAAFDIRADLIEKRDSGFFTGPRGLQGPSGAQGERGEQGIRGPQGELGPTGPQGERGAQGEPGESRGPKAHKAKPARLDRRGRAVLMARRPQGPKGETGPRGEQGPRGTAASLRRYPGFTRCMWTKRETLSRRWRTERPLRR